MPKTKKLYCYVDETGQDTKGRFFLVAIVITGEEREELIKELEKIEADSQKGTSKWKKTSPQRRTVYIEKVLDSHLFEDKISYAAFSSGRDYQEMTIIATSKAIISVAPLKNYEASVYIDALGGDERMEVATALRERHIKIKKVRGISDQSNALIRLADAVAGFVRDCLEGDENMKPLYQKVIAAGLLKKL